MPQPPATPLISRELVRVLPFAAQATFLAGFGSGNPTIVNGGTLVAMFDVSASITDGNQLLPIIGGLPAAAANIRFAVGPLLDWVLFADQASSVTIDYAVDGGCAFRNVLTTGVPPNTLTNVAGARITGRFLRVTYTNTSGGAAANVEFGIYVRSS